MKALLIILVFACHAFQASAKDMSSYRDTNELVWDAAFRSAVNRFFGRMRGSYFWYKGLISEQALVGLGGPPDDIRIIDGTRLFLASACRPHSCPEKAAVVLRDAGHPVAFGLLHYACFDQPEKDACSDRPVLVIYSKRSPVDVQVREAFVNWAEKEGGELGAIKTQVVR